MIEKNEGETKICESCGESFGCGADLGICWCFDIELPAEAATFVKTKYQDCLCPKCLAAAAMPSTEKDPMLV